MNLRNQLGTIITTLLLGAMTCLGGCATTGMQRSEKTGITMNTVGSDINQAVAQVDVTSASLQELVRPGQTDVKKAFAKYSHDFDRMEHLAKAMFAHYDKMGVQGKEYFEEWRKQGNTYTNPEIQALSEQRRTDLSAIFVRISESNVGVKGAFKAYLTDNREIRAYLSTDLTPKGVESITPVAQRAITDGTYLKDAVKPVLAAIDTAKAEMAPGGTK
jgi:hypothetical protein